MSGPILLLRVPGLFNIMYNTRVDPGRPDSADHSASAASDSKLSMLMLTAVATNEQLLFKRANSQSYFDYTRCNKAAELILNRLFTMTAN